MNEHKKIMDDIWANAEVIHVYTRAEAIRDGVLRDVTEVAKEAGFSIPCALTADAWVDCVKWTRDDELQDESGRLWDVVWMASMAARRHPNSDAIPFSLLRIPNNSAGTKPEMIGLWLVIGPCDNGEPVLTIGFPSDF